MNVMEARQFLADNKVKYILAQFVDIHGTAKTKAVPVAHFDEILANGAGFAGFAVWGLGIEPHGPDFMAVGDLPTLSLVPWQPGYARIVCDGHVNGKPWDYDTRVTLKKQLKRLEARGLTFYTGLEPEFSVLRRDETGHIVPCDPTDGLAKPCYDYKGLSRSSAFLERLVDCLIAAGIDVYQIDHEDANGQFEINYRHDHALAAADRLMLFKMAAHGVAEQLGLVFSLMPKPFADQPGSGLHFHLSLEDEAGRMVMADPAAGERLHLSVPGQQFLAGLLHHAGALTALCAPTVNSYKRLCAGAARSGSTWVPGLALYGDNNRSTLARITASRVEWRVPDGTCNPYLGIAAIIAAGLDGVERALDPGEPVLEDVGEWSVERHASYAGARLPATLAEAIAALEADERLRAALGEPVCAQFMTIKRQEWTDYRRRISEWEFAHTLSRY